MKKPSFDMKKLIYLAIALGITGIIVSPSPRCAAHSKDSLNSRPAMYVMPSADRLQLIRANGPLLNNLNNNPTRFKVSLYNVPDFSGPGWPFNKGFKKEKQESLPTAPRSLDTVKKRCFGKKKKLQMQHKR